MDVTCEKCGTVPFESCPSEKTEMTCTVHGTVRIIDCVQRHSCGAPLVANPAYEIDPNYSKFDPICWCEKEGVAK